MLKSVCVAVSVAVASVALLGWSDDAEAKRLAGGRPAGMQRQTPAEAPGAQPQNNSGLAGQSAQRQAATPTPAAPAPTPAAAPAKRSWLGPLAGLAAGLGIAALLSHFGLGDAFASFMTVLLMLGLGAVVLVWVVRKLRGGTSQVPAAASPNNMAWAGAGAGGVAPVASSGSGSGVSAMPASAYTDTSSAATADLTDFERLAKQIFIRLQAANDAADLEDLRKFTTPELFASLRLDLQERNGASQHTDVVQLNAQVVDQATQDGHPVVSVRFTGLIREERERAAEPFNEVWHLVGTAQGSSEWRIAGITPVQ